jgi:hypothetical protein
VRQGIAGSLSRPWVAGEDGGDARSSGSRGFPLRGLGRRPLAKGLVGEGELQREGGGERETEDTEEIESEGT